MVLEIAIPSFELIKKLGISLTFQYLTPYFIGFFVSFMVIALYWKFYLVYSRYITVFDQKLLSLNIYILLAVALFPFSTGFFVEGIDFEGPFTFYAANLVFLGLMMYIQLRVVLKRAVLQINKWDAAYLRYRGFLAVVFWVFMFFLSLWINEYVVYAIPLIFIFQLPPCLKTPDDF